MNKTLKIKFYMYSVIISGFFCHEKNLHFIFYIKYFLLNVEWIFDMWRYIVRSIICLIFCLHFLSKNDKYSMPSSEHYLTESYTKMISQRCVKILENNLAKVRIETYPTQCEALERKWPVHHVEKQCWWTLYIESRYCI